MAGYPGVEVQAPPEEISGAEIVLPLRLRERDGTELAFFGTISTFGTAIDITLSELAVEAFYPANAATATRMLREIDATGNAGEGPREHLLRVPAKEAPPEALDLEGSIAEQAIDLGARQRHADARQPL